MYEPGGLRPKFAVAPMLDWTDRHCRYFHRCLSKKALLYTEMIHAHAILFGARQAILRFDPKEHPLAVQLGGSDLKTLQEAAKICCDFGYDEINLNVGCPSPRVQAGAFGACLMKTPELVAELVAGLKDVVTIPVTVKCRIAVDDQESDEVLDRLAELCQKAGIDGFWVHARKAWLKGLSPKENRSIPPLDYQRVYRLKQNFPEIFIGINGGIASLEAGKHHLDFVDAVMLGRKIYHNPSLLAKVDSYFYNQVSTEIDYKALMEEMEIYCQRHVAEGGRLFHILRHMLGLFYGQKGAKIWRQWLMKFATVQTPESKFLQKAYHAIINN